MEKTKTTLILADGYEVRSSMDELRAHFDTAKAVDYFKSGELLAWLEERYYDATAAPIRALKQEYDRLAAAASAEDAHTEIYRNLLPKDEEIADFLRATLAIVQVETQKYVSGREAEKREQLQKRTDDAVLLSHAAQTAFTQGDLAELLDAKEKEIYLCGKEFEIPMRVGNVHYIGILGTPIVHIAAASPKDIKKRGISFSSVTVDYLEDELENFLEVIQNVVNDELTDNMSCSEVLILYEMGGEKSEIKNSIRHAAEIAENSLIARLEERLAYRLEQLEDVQGIYDSLCEERGVVAETPKPTLEEVRKTLEEGHERIVKEMTGKLAETLVSKARYELLDFHLLHGSDYLLDNPNELDEITNQLQRKYVAQYDKRDMEGVVQAYLRSVRRSVEKLRNKREE